MLRNSKVSISKPNAPSTINRTRSAILLRSIIEFKSLGHSKSVRRRCFPVTTVIGPFGVCMFCFVQCFTRDWMGARREGREVREGGGGG